MKTITIDVIKGTADVHAVEGDVGVKVIITNTPQEWKNCTVFGLVTQDSASQHIKVINNKFDVPPAFTDANKAFKIGVYAVGADGSRDVRPSIWIRVADSDFTTEDIEITSQTLEDILMLQAQYTQYENAEKIRAEAEKVRQSNESARIEAENNRKTELADIKTRLSGAETDIDKLEDGKVDKVEGYGLSQNDYTDHDAVKLAGIEYGAQENLPVDQTYKSKSSNAQSGKAVAEAIAKLVGSAPETLDTIEEVAKAIAENEDVVVALKSAIGNKADKTELDTKADKQTVKGGFAGGYNASVTYGGAIGDNASTTVGGAVGRDANAASGGAVGNGATTSNGFAGGRYAQTVDSDGNRIDAIQLGTGTNNTPKSLQIYNYTLMNADGRIPAERMAVRPITEIPATLSPNTSYNFGAVESLHIAFPAIANDGDVIYLTFMVGNSNTDITINFTYASDIDIEIEANTGYEIYAKYNGSIWIVGYSEYTVTDVESQ